MSSSGHVVSKKEVSGKSGIVKDENGYYKIPLGKLNSYTDNGVFYKVDDLPGLMTNSRSVIGSRIKMGIVRAEYKHPDFSGLTGADLVNRIFEIDLDRVCGHIKSIEYINTGKTERGWEKFPIYELYGWIKGTGPFGDLLNASLENPDENVSASIRSGVEEYWIGDMLVRTVVDISTWDVVHEQGVGMANQWTAAGIEKKTQEAVVCVNGSCLTKIRQMSVGAENYDAIQKLGNSLERKKTIYDWE